MTLINAGIPPIELGHKHLLAEHKEIVRIPNAVRTKNVNLGDLPKVFTLGTGHVRFFYNKLGYLKRRYMEIHLECLRRGYRVEYMIDAWDGLPEVLMGDYVPTDECLTIIKQRISERNGGNLHGTTTIT